MVNESTQSNSTKPLRRRRVSRKIISLDENKLVSFKPLFDQNTLGQATIDPAKGPLLIQANTQGVNLAEWTKKQHELLTEKLYQHGALLFRDFKLTRDEDFLQYMESVPYELLSYLERSSPRKTIAKNVYTSTVYPADEVIPLHNENTASVTFAMKVWFYCAKAADSRGETPIADARRILASIDPDVLDKFRALGWVLVRNYGNNLGYGWQDAFDGRSKSEVEEYCSANQVEMAWGKGTSEGTLWTRQLRSATVNHPVTGDECWFNHIAFWHPANLEPSVLEFMLNEVGVEGLPYNTFYGDGSKIPDDVARHLRDVYLKEKLMFSWQQGDVMLIDNMLTSHGRESYLGDRKIRVALADPFTRPDFVPANSLE